MNAKDAAVWKDDDAVGRRAQRLARVVIASLALAWLGYCLWALGIPGMGGPGGDFGVYMAIGHRILDGGPLYTAAQLAGPHVTVVGDAMYPPTTMPLILPFAVLPEPLARALWYGVPILTYAWAMWRIRPTGWPCVLALVLCVLPPSIEHIWLGNPALWAASATALGVLYRWPAVFVLLKPSLFPFAILGLRDRRGWLVLAAFAAVGLLTLPSTLDWVRVVLNARGQYSGLLYSVGDVPLMVAPLVAAISLAKRRRVRLAEEAGARPLTASAVH